MDIEEAPGSWVQYHDKDGMKDSHAVPYGDVREHVLSEKCWCDPVDDPDAPLRVITTWFHNAADGREDYEEGKRRPH